MLRSGRAGFTTTTTLLMRPAEEGEGGSGRRRTTGRRRPERRETALRTPTELRRTERRGREGVDGLAQHAPSNAREEGRAAAAVALAGTLAVASADAGRTRGAGAEKIFFPRCAPPPAAVVGERSKPAGRRRRLRREEGREQVEVESPSAHSLTATTFLSSPVVLRRPPSPSGRGLAFSREQLQHEKK